MPSKPPPAIIGPVRQIPEHLRAGFTMDGKIPVAYWFRDDSGAPDLARPPGYVEDYVQRFTRERIRDGGQGRESYKGASWLLCRALDAYPVAGKSVAVIGSMSPWVEAILLNYGAAKITTVEYNDPQFTHENIETLAYTEFETSRGRFDAVVTYSSIEHSGLGRYGDPLDPDGDKRAMESIHRSLKDKGILFWGAPVGHDVLVWNVHRIYGPVRLRYIFDGFSRLDRFDDATRNPLAALTWFRDRCRSALKSLLGVADTTFRNQPIYVLRKTAPEREFPGSR